jgi:WD40 repeat protein
LASGGFDGAAKVWDAATGREMFALPGGHGAVWSVAWKPDGTALAVGLQDGTIGIVEDLENTATVRFFQAHENPRREDDRPQGVRAVAWSPQGDRVASIGFDKLVKVWDPAREAELVRMEGQDRYVIGISWSPDGKLLAAGTADFVVLTWDAATGQKLQTMRGHNDFVEAVEWSPDGSRLASAGIDNAVRIWDPRTGQEAFVVRGNAGMFHDLSWNSDGARLAAACSDGQIWIWDARAGFVGQPAAPAAR